VSDEPKWPEPPSDVLELSYSLRQVSRPKLRFIDPGTLHDRMRSVSHCGDHNRTASLRARILGRWIDALARAAYRFFTQAHGCASPSSCMLPP
jgi:hypothetical protein